MSPTAPSTPRSAPVLLAATPSGLVRVAYEREGLDAVLRSLARQISPRVLRAPGGSTRRPASSRSTSPGAAPPSTCRSTSASRPASAGRCSAYLPAIGYGQTASYQSVAAAVHNPKAVRAVGTACATNPLPVVIPCHRVVRSDGQLGAYLGGPEIKHQLLDLEARR